MATHVHCAHINSKLACKSSNVAEVHVAKTENFLNQAENPHPASDLAPSLTNPLDCFVLGSKHAQLPKNTEARLCTKLFEKGKIGTTQEVYSRVNPGVSLEVHTIGEN